MTAWTGELLKERVISANERLILLNRKHAQCLRAGIACPENVPEKVQSLVFVGESTSATVEEELQAQRYLALPSPSPGTPPEPPTEESDWHQYTGTHEFVAHTCAIDKLLPRRDLFALQDPDECNFVFEDEDYAFFLGDINSAVDVGLLRSNNIAAVVNMVGGDKERVLKRNVEANAEDILAKARDNAAESVAARLLAEADVLGCPLRSPTSSLSAILTEGNAERYLAAAARGKVGAEFYAVKEKTGPSVLHYLEIAAEDSEDYDIAAEFPKVIEFVESVKKEAVSEKNGRGAKTRGRDGGQARVLFHCAMGSNRSTCVLAAMLLHHKADWGVERVVDHISRRRLYVLSNAGFLDMLVEFAAKRHEKLKHL